MATLSQWLKVLTSLEEDAVGPVRVSLVDHNGRQYASFCSTTGHELWLRTVNQPFLRQMVEIPASCPPEFAVRVDAQALRGWAHFNASMRRHLICWIDFDQAQGPCYLRLLEDAHDLPFSDPVHASRVAAIPASSPMSSPASVPPNIRFSATALVTALSHLKRKEVTILWRLGRRSISLRNYFGEEDFSQPAAEEAFIRVSKR